MAWTAFYPPKPTEMLMRVAYNKLNPKWKNDGTDNDWLVAIVPEDWSNTGNIISRETYQNKVTELTSNAILAFLYNGLVPHGVRNTNGNKASFGKPGTPLNPEKFMENSFYDKLTYRYWKNWT